MIAPATWIRSWSCIVFVAALAIAGECLIAAAMRRLGDLDALRTGTGLRSYLGPIRAVLSSPIFLIGALCMAFNFFAMLFTLSIVDLSLAAPATAYGYVVVALHSRFWLHEHLSVYRWTGILLIVCAVGFVAGGPSRTEHPSSHPNLDFMDSGAGR